MMKTKVNPFDYKEKYRLPIIISQTDIELEKVYFNYYNDVYMKKYKEEKYSKYIVDK